MDDDETEQAERTAWLHERATTHPAKKYPDILFWRAVQDFIDQQDHQLTVTRAEVDGRTWDHEQW